MFACSFSLYSFLAGPLAGTLGFPGKLRHHQAASITPGTYIFVQRSAFPFQLSKVMETSPDGFQCPVCYHKVCLGLNPSQNPFGTEQVRNECPHLSVPCWLRGTSPGGKGATFPQGQPCSVSGGLPAPLFSSPQHCLAPLALSPPLAEHHAEVGRTLNNFCLWSQKRARTGLEFRARAQILPHTSCTQKNPYWTCRSHICIAK